MTYADMYDEYLEELYRAQVDKIDFLRGCHIGKLCKEHDEIMYNTGFNDWSDSLESVKCSECEREVEDDDARSVSQDAEVLCAVCAVDAFECATCGEVVENKDEGSVGVGVCIDCEKEAWAESQDDNEEVNDPDPEEDPLDD